MKFAQDSIKCLQTIVGGFHGPISGITWRILPREPPWLLLADLSEEFVSYHGLPQNGDISAIAAWKLLKPIPPWLLPKGAHAIHVSNRDYTNLHMLFIDIIKFMVGYIIVDTTWHIDFFVKHLVANNINNAGASHAKKAGSQLKSRIVAEKPVAECAKLIEDLEDQISTIIREERLASCCFTAENMIAHKEEIYSRPKRTWHTTEREKMLLAKAAKESLDKGRNSSGVISAKQAEDLRLKEKKRREQEKNLPRKKRRRLEAQREMLEDSEDGEDTKESKGGNNKTKKGQSLVDVAYRRAKSMKASNRKVPGAGKGKTDKKGKQHSDKVPSRQEEMHELFQNDMSEWKQGRALNKNNNFARKKSKNAFKSKSRYVTDALLAN
ncbi:hypothetical protein PR202_gb23754 [Eleusine coracana subsp. coracana]|uniref:Uncharacterized protein n=1 Tax=Eleusine coracana subsp. coracana TaxID=191504 RepID=A0AAV5FJF0_ELECO|nr:hypothetical protein PR202_gb23754 [Eleusine coracana subsp. coracana]